MAVATVTLVFTDLVGSTDLLSRVGESAADELRREHFGVLRQVFADHGGREVKNLGDGLMIAFDGVSSAIDAAVAMQQAVTARPPDAEPLAVRIGIGTGDVDVEDDDYFGRPVVEAARLCAHAEGGEVLVTQMVHLLARSRTSAELEPVGELELKGLDEPVDTWRVRWAPRASADRPPLPGRLDAAVASNFVGRVAERAQLDAAWKAVIAGDRRAVFLVGEPGIGKTTLAAGFAAAVHDDGGIVVYGRCDEDLGIPYQPWTEVLRHLVASAPDAVLDGHVQAHGSHLVRLVPELAGRLDAVAPAPSGDDTDRSVLYACATDLLVRFSVDAPVLVVLDDLHWADAETVQLLRHLLTADVPLRLGVLGTFRDSEVAADDPISGLLAALHREGGSERIALRGLGDDDVLALLERLAGHDLDDAGLALRDAVLDETGGNPFFTVEVLRHLAESGAIYQDEGGRWVSDADLEAVGLPVSVREVIGRRVAALGPEFERVLALGSVIGRDFQVSLLAAAAAVDEDRLVDLCDAAVAAAVLQETEDPDRYTFAHALIEHTLYRSLSAAKRARAHRAVAEALESRVDADGRVGELAHHWSQAVTPADDERALHYATLAGHRALDQLAPDEALRWFRRAAELAEDSGAVDARRQTELLISLALAEKQCGLVEHREHFLDAARRAEELGEVDLMIDAVLKSSRGGGSLIGDVDHERADAIERTLALVGDDDPVVRARLLALLLVERRWVADPTEQRRLVLDAVASARRSGDSTTLAEVLLHSALIESGPDTLEERNAAMDEALGLVDDLAHPVLACQLLLERIVMALVDADLPTLRALEERRQAIEARFVPADTRWLAMNTSLLLELLHGTIEGAEAIVDASYRFGTQIGQADAFTLYAAEVVGLRFHQGRWAECIELIETAVAESPELEDVYSSVLAFAHARAGDPQRAAALLDEAARSGFPVHRGQNWSIILTSWSEVAVLLGRRDVAPELRRRMAPHARHITMAGATFAAPVGYFLGRLDHMTGRLDEAEAWFTEAHEIARALESPLLTTYVEVAVAELWADRGEDERARALATSALATAEEIGLGAMAFDARTLLDRLDEARPR